MQRIQPRVKPGVNAQQCTFAPERRCERPPRRLDTPYAPPLCLRPLIAMQSHRIPMTFSKKATAILADSHFLIPLAVFFIGLTLLITLH